MYSIISRIRKAAVRLTLIIALLLLSVAIARAHNTNLSNLEIKGPW
jgi:hypothetical protein